VQISDMSAMATIGSLASVTITGFLVIVLVRGAWHKAASFLETVGFADGYELVPEWWTATIVRGLIAIEVTVVLALVIPALHVCGALMAAGLFAGYGMLMAIALLRGKREIDCGCGGPPQLISTFTLCRNAVLTGLALAAAVLPVTSVSLGETAFAIAAALVLTGDYVLIERLASHLPNIRQGNA
jgi:hypothetical protein